MVGKELEEFKQGDLWIKQHHCGRSSIMLIVCIDNVGPMIVFYTSYDITKRKRATRFRTFCFASHIATDWIILGWKKIGSIDV